MAPPCTDFGTGRHCDNGAVGMLDILVASEGGIVDILDGIVAVGSADALELALVGAVDRHLLEDSVARCQGREAEDDRLNLHDYSGARPR